MDDAAFVAQVKAGDRESFGQLVVRHQGAMLGIARSYFASEADALDAVQDAFVKAFERIGQLGENSAFPGWLARITINTCLDALRSRTDKVSLNEFASTAQLKLRTGDVRLTPATLATRGELCDLVRVALGHLPEDQRVVLMLYFGESMTYDGIARYLDVPTPTVQGRLRRGKKALRSVLRTLGCA